MLACISPDIKIIVYRACVMLSVDTLIYYKYVLNILCMYDVV